jgi:hypothetical protein
MSVRRSRYPVAVRPFLPESTAIVGSETSAQFIQKFGLHDWLQTADLTEWLRIATADLEKPAKQRIAQEIEVHYADAIRYHSAAGKFESDARIAALEELGDPHVAANRFQKTYLTASEARWFRPWERVAFHRMIWLALNLTVIVALIALRLFHRNLSSLEYVTVFALVSGTYTTLISAPYLLNRLGWGSSDPLRVRAFSIFLGSTAAWLTLGSSNLGRQQPLLGAFIICWSVYRLNKGIHIWTKLARARRQGFDLPPSPAAHS